MGFLFVVSSVFPQKISAWILNNNMTPVSFTASTVVVGHTNFRIPFVAIRFFLDPPPPQPHSTS